MPAQKLLIWDFLKLCISGGLMEFVQISELSPLAWQCAVYKLSIPQKPLPLFHFEGVLLISRVIVYSPTVVSSLFISVLLVLTWSFSNSCIKIEFNRDVILRV